MTSEFDVFEDSYVDDLDEVVAFSGKSTDFFTSRKADLILELAGRQLGDPTRLDLLDVGCGIGLTDGFLTGRVGSLAGTDVSSPSLARAREANAGVRYESSSEGEPLPFEDDSFDLSFAICVVHHVPRHGWRTFLSEMKRVTRPGGLVAIFEHNPLNPATRKIVRDCVFDENVTLIRAGLMKSLLGAADLTPVESRQILFLPVAAPWWLRVERRLARVPLGAQYYAAGRV